MLVKSLCNCDTCGHKGVCKFEEDCVEFIKRIKQIKEDKEFDHFDANPTCDHHILKSMLTKSNTR